jgi:cell wall assembly regulator SMI1
MTPAVIVIAVVLFVAGNVLLARLALRRFFYPRPRTFPPPAPATDGQTTEQLLAKLDEVLDRHARGVAVALRPGLTDEQINALEWKHHCTLSEDLRALYRWHDGMPRGEKTPDLIPGHWFVPLAEAMQLREQMRREVRSIPPAARLVHAAVAGHRLGWLHVLDDGCGDGYFYDPDRRNRDGSFFFHFAQDRQYHYFRALADFVAGVIECYESGAYHSNAAGAVDEDFKKSSSLWPRFAEMR